MTIHQPVLLNEVLHYLNPKPNQHFIDCTVGGGGHALAILKRTGPNGKILGIDDSPGAIANLESETRNLKLNQKFILVNDNFANLKEIVKKNNFQPIQGILVDLGLSSDLLEKSQRGFSFMRDEILDMRFNPTQNDLTAQKIISQYSRKELIEIFREFGQERFAGRIAAVIVDNRRKEAIKTTGQLVNLIQQVLGRRFHVKSLARIFQALRITVNTELENLKEVLRQSIVVLAPGGKIIVIAYHSLEDRIVKIFFKQFKQEEKLRIITKKPIRPSPDEIKTNPRARSARLRAGEKI